MLFKYEGWSVPQVTFQLPTDIGWKEISTADIFAQKRVVAFTVSGAFTQPYSPVKLLGYNRYAEVFRNNGIDEIICISVNDPFSLRSWAQEEGADQVSFMPDVNGDFTRSMGMMIDLSHRGMGWRSHRYSMLVNNGIIEKLFVEQGDFEAMPVVSNAETMLNYINPKAQKPEETATLMHIWRAMLSA